MEFFKDKNAYTSILVFTVLALIMGTGRQDPSLIDIIVSSVTCIFSFSINIYFLKFVSNGVKINKKPPYDEISYSAWSYIWRVFVALWLSLFFIPLLFLVPEALRPIIGTILFLSVSNAIIFLLFCKNKAQKLNELKVFFSGISI